MPRTQNLFLRGSVYYWRRKLRRLSTGFIDLQISTLTTNKRKALIIGRGLSYESDLLMDRIAKNLISPQETKAYLISERNRLVEDWDRKKTVFMNDVIEGAENDHIHNWAAETSWRLIDAYGINVKLTEDVLRTLGKLRKSKRHVAFLDLHLDLNRQLLRNEGKLLQMKARFRDITGRQLNDAGEVYELRRLYTKARVASFDYTQGSAIDKFAEQVFAEYERDQGNSDPKEQRSHSEPPADNVTNGCSLDQNTSSPESAVFMENFDPTVAAIIERMIKVKKYNGGRFEEATANHYRSFSVLLTRITNKTDIRTFNQTDASRLRDTLLNLPKSFGKSPKHKAQPIAEILQQASNLPKEKVGLDPSTINRYLDYLIAILNAAKSEGIKVDDLINPGSLRLRNRKRDRDRAKTATHTELVKFFSHSLWTDRSQSDRSKKLKSEKHYGGFYWIPLLCAYGGFRRAEVAGLLLSDLRCEDGIYYLNIDFNEIRPLKTKASVRQVPLHDDIIKLGFLDFCNDLKNRKARMLFQEASRDSDVDFGRKFTRDVSRISKEVFEEEADHVSLHSMRHYVQNILDLDQSVPDKVSRDLIGHEGFDVHTRTYGAASPLAKLKAAIDVLPSVIDTSVKYQG